MECFSQGKQGGSEVVAILGPRPEHGLIVGAVPVSVLDGQLRLTHAAQTAEGLRLPVLLPWPEGGSQLRQDVLAAGEEGIARVGNGPDLLGASGGSLLARLDGALVQVGNGTA